MALSFLVLFPIGIVLALRKSKLHSIVQSAAYLVFMAGYFLGHSISGDWKVSAAHVSFQPFLLIIVNSQVILGLVAKTIKSKASVSHYSLDLVATLHRFGALLMILGPYIQIMTGITTTLGVCQPSEFGNCLAHLSMGSFFIFLGSWGLFQTVGLLKSTTWSRDRVTSIIILIFGFINTLTTHRWGYSWSHRDFQHVSSGLMWIAAGLLCCMVEFKCKAYFQSNPVPALTLFLEGVQMIAHTQHSEFAIVIHKAFGWALILASLFHWMDLYRTRQDEGSNTSSIVSVLSNVFCILAGLYFMSGNSDAIWKASQQTDIDPGSYVTGITAVGLIICFYVYSLAALYSKKEAIPNECYARLESQDTLQEMSGPIEK